MKVVQVESTESMSATTRCTSHLVALHCPAPCPTLDQDVPRESQASRHCFYVLKPYTPDVPAEWNG